MTILTIHQNSVRKTPLDLTVNVKITLPSGAVFATGRAFELNSWIGWSGTIEDPDIRHWDGGPVTWHEDDDTSIDEAVEGFVSWAVTEFERGPTPRKVTA